jgi:hypothetical protein
MTKLKGRYVIGYSRSERRYAIIDSVISRVLTEKFATREAAEAKRDELDERNRQSSTQN